MTTDDPDRSRQLASISRVFTPSTPVTEAGVFAGRRQERDRLIRAVFEPGRHAVVYGARGVGKTSLINIVGHTLSEQGGAADEALRTTVRVPCTREDTFDSIWRHLAREVSITPLAGAETVIEPSRPGGRSPLDIAETIYDHPGFVTPTDIERVLRRAARAVLVFDEFDTLLDRETRTAFADTIKMTSDAGTGPSIVLVGVGADIGALIEDHESIQRCVQQVPMPTMTDDETRTLVLNGFHLLDLDIEGVAVEQIVWLSRGFPSFAHSLAKQAATVAAEDGRALVGIDDVFVGAVEALEGVPYSLGEVYSLAVDSRHPADTTPMILAAAAYAGGPNRFRPTDVQEVLAEWGVAAQLQTVTNRLKGLCRPNRGSVLRTTGSSVHPAYEFSDPMMPPYVVIMNVGKYPPAAQA